MEVSLEVCHQCTLCSRYFLGSSAAAAHAHLCQFSNGKLLKNNEKQRSTKCPIIIKSDVDSCIKVISFPEVKVNVGSRLREEEIRKWSSKRIKRESSGNDQSPDDDEKVEIRLDSMKASEIEKIMRNVYQPASSSASIKGNGNLEISSSFGDGETDEDEEDDDINESRRSSEVSSSSSDDDEEEESRNEDADNANLNTSKRKGRRRKNPGEVEIKLDSLRASEIETLMKGLFQVQDPAKMPYKNPTDGYADTDYVRRSGRRAKERFKRGFGELDSSDEEIIKTGTGRKRGRPKKKSKEDPDFNVSHSGEQKKLHKKRSSRSIKNAVIIKQENEDLATLNEQEHNNKRSPRYCCRFCVIKFNHTIHYSEHMKEKHGNSDGTFRCQVCEGSYATINSLFQHFRKIHVEGDDASSTEQSEQELQEKARDYCNTCDIQFPDGTEFSKHMSEVHIDEEGNIVCQICQVLHTDKDPPTFSSKKSFLRHRRNHYSKSNRLIVDKNPKRKGPFECAVCKKVIAYWSLYMQHLHTHTQKKTRKVVIDPTKNHECPVCQIRLSNITSFKRHFTKHLETNPFRCKVGNCDKTFGDYYHLTKHFMAVHTRSGELLQCKECPARYCNAYYYQRHYREAHRNVPCPIPFTTANPMALLSSTSNVAETDAASTQDSGKESVTKKTEENAESTPTIKKEVDYIVDDLDEDDHDSSYNPGEVQSEQAFVSLQNKALVEDPVVVNMKRDNPEGYKLIADLVRLAKSAPKECYKCDKCDWSAGSYMFYQRHMTSVHNETPKGPKAAVFGTQPKEKDVDPSVLTVSCGTCGFQAKTTDELTKHMDKEHFGNRKFPCLKCGTRLTSKSGLDEHDHRVHGDGEKFPCETCDAVYSSQMSLAAHMKRKHGPKKDFDCPTCGKVLTTKLGLREHLKRHTGEAKRSVCQICGQTYATVYVLARHIQMMHTKTLKLVQVKGKSKKFVNAAVLAAAEAELEAAEKQNAERQSAVSESEIKAEDDIDKADSDSLIKQEPSNVKTDVTDCQEIIGF